MLANDSARAGQKAGAGRARDRAAAYRLLSWFLLESPDEHFLDAMMAGDVGSWLTSDDAATSPVAGGLAELRDFLAARQAGGSDKLCLELATQWTRLFRGVAPGYGPRPPYEAIYRAKEGGAQGELLLDLGRLYSEAGVALLEGRTERLDYLGLELDVMGLLCSEESAFRLQGSVEDAVDCRDLQRRFLQEHLLSWATAYCEVILNETGVPFYHGVARALSAFLSDEALSLDPAS